MHKLGMLGASVLLMMVAPAIAAENLKDEVDKIGSQYMQYFNKKDAAGITSLYTKNYLRVNQGGVVAVVRMRKVSPWTLQLFGVTSSFVRMGNGKSRC